MTYSFRQRKKELAFWRRSTRETVDKDLEKRGMPLSKLAQLRVVYLLSDLPVETPEPEETDE